MKSISTEMKICITKVENKKLNSEKFGTKFLKQNFYISHFDLIFNLLCPGYVSGIELDRYFFFQIKKIQIFFINLC